MNRLNYGNVCTGQDKCYNTDNSGPTDCPAQGADFFGQDSQYADLGYCTPKSFAIRGSGSEKTVFDQNIGLEWQQTIPSSGYTWSAAKTYCSNLTYAGYDDWRLPTPKEVLTIIDSSNWSPATDTDYFPGDDVFVWTSKQFKGNTSYSWLINIRWGYTNNDLTTNSQSKDPYQYKVRCVRGPEMPEGTFESTSRNGDVIVTDTSTGLIWQKTSVSSKKWQQALKYCEDLSYGGYTDWRLPNMNELHTLISYDKFSPASDFPGMPYSNFWLWSSTNVGLVYDADTNTRAFSISTSNASMFLDDAVTIGVNDVKCVRSEN